MGRPPLERIGLRYLLVQPVLLSIITVIFYFANGDTNIPALYSQCQAHSLVPWLTHNLPVLGTPLCFLVSLIQEALGSHQSSTRVSYRAFAVMGEILALLSGLLTVTTVEAGRVGNAPNALLRHPTLSWLLFNALGGCALVWHLVTVPEFLRRGRQVFDARKSGTAILEGYSGGVLHPEFGDARRHLKRGVADAVAIPVAVALGYFAPAALMLATRSSIAVFVWQLFPLWVSLLRRAARLSVAEVARWREERQREHGNHAKGGTFHVESRLLALLALYALPIICSVPAHAFLIWSIVTGTDDCREMTHAALRFVEVNAISLGVGVLYWLLVEAGWRPALVTAGVSLILGPGAGICAGWVVREEAVGNRRVAAVAVGRERDLPSVRMPLLR